MKVLLPFAVAGLALLLAGCPASETESSDASKAGETGTESTETAAAETVTLAVSGMT